MLPRSGKVDLIKLPPMKRLPFIKMVPAERVEWRQSVTTALCQTQETSKKTKKSFLPWRREPEKKAG